MGEKAPRRPGRLTLEERSRRSGAGSVAGDPQGGVGGSEPRATSGPPDESRPQGAADEPQGRHCWVVDPPGHPGRWPGLLVEWRQDHLGWQGRVVYSTLVDGRHLTVEAWLKADRLSRT